VLAADKVLELASALESLDATWLRRQCELLFPNDETDDWVAELTATLAAAQGLYQQAAESGRSVLFTSDELLKDIYPLSAQT
jgi:hypothetical protein